MIKQLVIVGIVLFVSFSGFFNGVLPESKISGEVEYERPDSNTAKALAFRIIGLDTNIDAHKADSMLRSISKTVIVDTTTPFISDEIDGKEVWCIELQDVNIEPVKEDNKDILRMNFKIYIDYNTAIPLKVIVPASAQIGRMPKISESEKLLGAFKESYEGIPDIQPEVSIIEALEYCKTYSHMAKEIVVNYVLYSQEHYTEFRPAWVVYMRGLPDIRIHEAGPLEYGGTTMRYVIDAITGTGLCRNNLPYPFREK